MKYFIIILLVFISVFSNAQSLTQSQIDSLNQTYAIRDSIRLAQQIQNRQINATVISSIFPISTIGVKWKQLTTLQKDSIEEVYFFKVGVIDSLIRIKQF